MDWNYLEVCVYVTLNNTFNFTHFIARGAKNSQKGNKDHKKEETSNKGTEQGQVPKKPWGASDATKMLLYSELKSLVQV